MDAIEGEAESREMRDFRLVRLLGKGIALEYFPGRIDDAEEFLFQHAHFHRKASAAAG